MTARSEVVPANARLAGRNLRILNFFNSPLSPPTSSALWGLPFFFESTPIFAIESLVYR